MAGLKALSAMPDAHIQQAFFRWELLVCLNRHFFPPEYADILERFVTPPLWLADRLTEVFVDFLRNSGLLTLFAAWPRSRCAELQKREACNAEQG